MLRINVPPNGPAKIDYSTFRNYLLPVPPNGIDSEANNNLVLLFDNPQKAIAYAKELKGLQGSQKKVGNEIIAAIVNDLSQ